MADTAYDRAALRRRIRDILLSAPCQKIDFYYPYGHGFGINRFKIDGWALSFVALALDSPTTGGRGIRIEVTRIGGGAMARYVPEENLLRFPFVGFGQWAPERNGVVHECVHALRDALATTSRINGAAAVPLGRTRTVDDEAAAYIAAALFTIYEATPDGGTPQQPSWIGAAKGQYIKAHAIAAKIWKTPGATIDADDAAELRQAIMARPLYRDLKRNPETITPNDGIKL
jgi:hypothetical protein